jgi:hypothetical protein
MPRKLALVAFGVMIVTHATTPPTQAANEGGTDMDTNAQTGVDGSDQGSGFPDVVPDPTADVRVQQPVQAAVPTVEPPRGGWDDLAHCESTERWHLEGRVYSGGLQFDAPTWLAYGGSAYAPRAALATRGQQIAVAERLRAARGYQPWPVCSRVVGLR